MATSLFVEHQANGTAFYINGELQFHSADEAIYHEYLTIPAIALAVKRFPDQDLRVLVCGGGDGLALRDILRYPQVSHVDLVDYSQEVIDLGKQAFADFNQASLSNPKVTIHIHEAFSFVTSLIEERLIEEIRGDHKYHVIICDFTYPASIAETQIYALEWFELLKQVLVPSGMIATNAVSPDRNTLAFWCIYQTMQAAGLAMMPMQLQIPSFANHDYGNWGFLLASDMAIAHAEIDNLDIPSDLREFNLATWRQISGLEQFDQEMVRHTVIHHQKDSSQLLFYLLNRTISTQSNVESNLEPNLALKTGDPMSLDALAKVWLNQLESNPEKLQIPAQHHSQTPEISQEWLERVKQLLNQIDLSRLIAKLLERSQELPQEIAADLRELQIKLTNFQVSDLQKFASSPLVDRETSVTRPSFSLTTAKVIAILSLTLLIANLAAPDAVFAKGSSSFASSGSGDGNALGFMGLMMTIGGVCWLINLADDSNQK